MQKFYQPVKFGSLFASDYSSFLVSFNIAWFVRLALPSVLPFIKFPAITPIPLQLPHMHLLPVIMFGLFFFSSLYQKRLTFWEELLLIWKGICFNFLIFYLVIFNFSDYFIHVSRIVVGFTFIGMVVLTPFFRWITKQILFKLGFWRYPVLVACDEKDLVQAERVASALHADRFLGFCPEGFYIPQSTLTNTTINDKNFPIYNTDEGFSKVESSTLFVVGGGLSGNHSLLSSLYGKFRRIFLVPSGGVFGLTNSGVQYLFSERLFIIPLENKINSLTAHIIKDLWDYIGGFFILLACSPLFIIVAIAIKVSSPGPIFYRHERIGRHGKPFKIWKFRSMHVDAEKKLQDMLASDPALAQEWKTYFKLANDPRITPIGNFLRKYSIDEFPQLFNVLAGQMSLIGPRPFVKGEMDELNPNLVPLYTQLKPGLTGLWQVSGRNEANRLERMEIDVWYIQNWSPTLDLLILLNTPKAVLTARGAR
ncbi:MAG: exopolysaccharide biosynthesis polyprenyl glycosylphosphotransferase [Brevinema sp.]